ncbi:hypothetical protein Y695_04447 [Hydrogenophaga sp. T4]|nr:hypothetical protein Y695_04447 [Hydrogenophaga sp. T4]
MAARRSAGSWFTWLQSKRHSQQPVARPGVFMRCRVSRPSTSWNGTTRVLATDIDKALIRVQLGSVSTQWPR